MKQRFAIIFTVIIILLMGIPITATAMYSAYKNNRTECTEYEEDGYSEEADTTKGAIADEDGAAGTEDPEETGDNEESTEPGEITESEDDTESGENEVSAETEDEPEEEPVPLDKYDALLEVNPYVTGWLSIDGTKIDDPVVYTPGSQNYFLHRALDGSPSEKGTFFIAINWREGAGNNTLVYGHNMKDGSGFGSLQKFADPGFGQKHPVIRFDTLYEEKEYELLAAFYSQIDEEELETEDDRADRDRQIAELSIAEKEAEGITLTEEELTVADLDLHRDFGDEDIYRAEKDEDNGRFRYYYFNDLSDENDFNYFINNVRERQLYDTGVTASFGDELLTLSTCSYQVKNGRFVVVAVHHKE